MEAEATRVNWLGQRSRKALAEQLRSDGPDHSPGGKVRESELARGAHGSAASLIIRSGEGTAARPRRRPRLRREGGLVETIVPPRESGTAGPRRYYHLSQRRRSRTLASCQETAGAGFCRRRSTRSAQRREPRTTVPADRPARPTSLVRRSILSQLDRSGCGALDASPSWARSSVAEVRGHIEEERTGLDHDDSQRVDLVSGPSSDGKVSAIARCHRRQAGADRAPGQPPLGRVGSRG